jgi:myo-inositol-1(or 4)-monophosphatase
MPTPDEDLQRIVAALREAGALLQTFMRDTVTVRYKAPLSPVTDADLAADRLLRRRLPRADEGWLSEESADDRGRLARRRVWVVDPLDGTNEFLTGVPQWTVSIGLVQDGVAVAGGVYNPSTDEMFVGALGAGVTLNGAAVPPAARSSLDGAVIVLSRWAQRKRWGRLLADRPCRVLTVNPLAYALALVGAGRADAMWSRPPKNEWDVAAGAALVAAAGGTVTTWDGRVPRFNGWPPRLPGIVASSAPIARHVRRLLRAA